MEIQKSIDQNVRMSLGNINDILQRTTLRRLIRSFQRCNREPRDCFGMETKEGKILKDMLKYQM